MHSGRLQFPERPIEWEGRFFRLTRLIPDTWDTKPGEISAVVSGFSAKAAIARMAVMVRRVDQGIGLTMTFNVSTVTAAIYYIYNDVLLDIMTASG